tara:strand:- start:32 stop:1582 length:1551 start_codon:yes stop_codon:yes gene_type:complete
MTTETVEKVDYTDKSVYYPTRNTESKTVTYKIGGKTYNEVINLKNNGNFLNTESIYESGAANADGGVPITIIDPNEANGVFSQIHNNSARTDALSNAYSEIEEQSKNFGKYDKFQKYANESNMTGIVDGTSSIDATIIDSEAYDTHLEWQQNATNLENNSNTTSDLDSSKIKKNPKMDLASMNMQYPKDALYTKGQDYLYIQQFLYRPPQANQLTKGENSFLEAAEDNSLTAVTSGLRRGSNIKESQGSVKLPIPNGLNVSNGVGWGEGRANSVEAGAFFQAFGSAQDLITQEKNVAQIIKENFQAAGGLLDGLKKDAEEGKPSSMVLSAVLAKAALSKMNINVDPAQFITRSTGSAINPNLELLFSGPKLRNFTFSFMFAPNDNDEASEVRKIIRWFKQGMAPKQNRENLIYLASPNVFRLKYMNSGRRIKGLNIFKICALTGVELDLAPSKTYQSYEDSTAISMPPMIGMALSFTELTPIFENNYSELNPENDASIFDLDLKGNDSIGPEDIGF